MPQSRLAGASLFSAAPGDADHLDYWRQSQRPLTSLIFVLPFLFLYEGGVLLLGSSAMRNGAEVWLTQLLDLAGFEQSFLLPLLVIVALLGWHHLTGDRWRVRSGVTLAMGLECAVLGFVLMLIAQLHRPLLHAIGTPLAAAARGPIAQFFASFVSYCGAGIYEEVMFRLLLLPAVAICIRAFGVPLGTSFLWSALVTSLLFSAAHHVGPHGEALELFKFTFRVTAGLFFSLLFIFRGFGIVVGTHALYDIFVGLL
ncbi:MAG: CPBP family glutamic-type intramembrane protease [Pirellulales bacterium]